jgi:hypothetical protein
MMFDRAPVLALWAIVVAEVLGFEHGEALTLRRDESFGGGSQHSANGRKGPSPGNKELVFRSLHLGTGLMVGYGSRGMGNRLGEVTREKRQYMLLKEKVGTGQYAVHDT